MEPIKFIEQEFAAAQVRIRELEVDNQTMRKFVAASCDGRVDMVYENCKEKCRLRDAEMSELRLTIKRLNDRIMDMEDRCLAPGVVDHEQMVLTIRDQSREIKRLKDQLAECEAVVNLIMRLTHVGEFYEAARAYRAKYPGPL